MLKRLSIANQSFQLEHQFLVLKPFLALVGKKYVLFLGFNPVLLLIPNVLQYAHAHVSMKTFGGSGKGPALMEHFGFTVANVVDKATKLVQFYDGAPAPSLVRPEL